MSDKTFKQQVEEIIPDDTDSSRNCLYQFHFKACSYTDCKTCITDRILAAHNAELGRQRSEDRKAFNEKLDRIGKIDFRSDWYKNCKRQRQRKSKCCDSCPFQAYIQAQKGS